MNALKHVFPGEKSAGEITVAYEVDGPNWKLSVADNGAGKPEGVFAQPKTGLGSGIVKALARQLDAFVETSATPEGTVVSIVHATFSTKAGRAAQDAPISFAGSPAAALHAEALIASKKRDG